MQRRGRHQRLHRGTGQRGAGGPVRTANGSVRCPGMRPPASIRYRTDATAKVTGEKIFSYDMRGRDLPGWPDRAGARDAAARRPRPIASTPASTSRCSVTRSSPTASSPPPTCSATAWQFPRFYGEDMLLPEGKTPAYLGQAVALLVWHDFARFRAAKTALKFRDDVIRWGAQTGPLERAPWASFRYVRVGGATPFDDDAYSSLKDTPLFPAGYRKNRPAMAAGESQWRDRRAGRWPTPRRSAAALDAPGDDTARAGARVLFAVDRHRRIRARQRQRLVRRRQRHAAPGRGHAVAAGNGRRRRPHACGQRAGREATGAASRATPSATARRTTTRFRSTR